MTPTTVSGRLFRRIVLPRIFGSALSCLSQNSSLMTATEFGPSPEHSSGSSSRPNSGFVSPYREKKLHETSTARTSSGFAAPKTGRT